MVRFFFRLLPWWLFAFLAFAFLQVALHIVTTQWETYQNIQAAKAMPEPEAQPAATFDIDRHVSKSGEVAISDLVQVTPTPQLVETTGSDLVYVVFMSRNARRAFVAYSNVHDKEALVEAFKNARGSGGFTVLRGFLEPITDQPELRSAALDDVREFGLSRDDVFVVDPYNDDRAAGLRNKQGEALFIAAFAILLQALLSLVAYLKWRGSRRRKAARRLRKPTPTPKPAPKAQPAGPWGATKPVSTTRSEAPAPSVSVATRRVGRKRVDIGDGFDESPIKTTGRWWSR